MLLNCDNNSHTSIKFKIINDNNNIEDFNCTLNIELLAII